ncbi:MAG: BamA/TamA family outer membrane protein [Candidatus Latescibacterota bacterium]|nr:MAG: BamA/TamA family outer membrane protein [Candidatus Latescibacterota bacterium]
MTKRHDSQSVYETKARYALTAVAVVLTTVCLSVTALASDWDASAYKDWEVSKVTVVGLDKEMSKSLVDGLALAMSSGFLGRGRPLFFPQTLDEDIKRTKLFMTRHGYPYAIVTPGFIPDARKNRVELVLEIDRGPPVRVSSVTVNGIPAGMEEKISKEMAVAADSILTDAGVARTLRSTTDLLLESGHARAEVESEVYWVDTTHVDVTVDINAGPVYYCGDYVVTGASDDLIPVVKRTARIRPGRRFEPRLLEEAQRNLRLLGLFRQIRLEIVDAAPDTLDFHIDVLMREPRRIETGLRYWTDEKLHGNVLWVHRNLFKKGRGGSALASASSVLQRVELSTWIPAVLAARSRLSFTLGLRRESEDAYESVGYGGEVALNYDFSLETILRIAVVISNVEITEKTDDPDLGDTNDGILNELSVYWERNKKNNPIVPTGGFFTSIMARWAPDGPWNDYKYVMAQPTVSYYHSLPRAPRVVFATRLTVGLGKPIGDKIDIPPNKRFYSGGANSMRGFERRKLGPLDAGGAPLGGEAKLEASAELRFPLIKKFHATTFVDAGQVWTSYEDITLDNVEVAIGPGLWFDTPVGPVRVDYGYRVTNYDTTQRRYAWHFSIGPAF